MKGLLILSALLLSTLANGEPSVRPSGDAVKNDSQIPPANWGNGGNVAIQNTRTGTNIRGDASVKTQSTLNPVFIPPPGYPVNESNLEAIQQARFYKEMNGPPAVSPPVLPAK